MIPCVLLFFFTFLQVSLAVNSQLSDEEYDLMPPIARLDPFEKCLRRPGGRYCTASVTFVADDFSPLLQQMQEYSDQTSSHFNHTQALFGTCLTTYKCENFYHNTTTDLRRALEACLNQSIWKEYNLKVKVEDDISCHEYNEKRLNIGAMDIAVAGVLLALLICNAVGSIFDFYYTKPDGGLVVQFLLCFSISRNWKKLTSPMDDADPRLKRLKGIYGIRAISMTLIIVAHGLMPFVVLPENPKFIEDQYDFLPAYILLNGPVIMQTFLFLSAFLLVYTSLLYAEKHKVTWKMLPKSILKRWLRLTPAYALVLAVTATWMRHVSTGPIWDKIVVYESLDCRRYWWQHLLYINNYEDVSLCMQQTWYLATDTQLYCLGLIIFVFCQSPIKRKIVLTTLFLIGLIIPALHTYYQDLDGVLVVSPSTSATLFRNDRTFDEVYKRGHTNIASYVTGIAFGYLLYSLQKDNFDVSKYTRWRPLYWLLFLLALSMTMFCKVFYEDGDRMSVYYRVLAAAFIKPVFGVLMGLTITGAILKMDNLYRRILEWRGWMCPSRVSYSVYLLHMAIIRGTCGAQDHPIRISNLRVAEIILCVIMMTYILAYLFWLTVEAPLGQLLKTCLGPRPRSVTMNDIDPKNTYKINTKL